MIRAFQWDLARQIERFDWLLAQLPRYADWGYNELYLHLEDAIEYPSLPEVARADAYSYRQMTRLTHAASRVGIKVVPIVNLLGHTQYLIKVPAFRDLNELRAPDGSPLDRGQVCPVHPRTLEIAGRLLRDVAPFCTAGKVHVGLDESFHLGKHPESRREIGRIGLAAHFANYVGRLNQLVRGLGLRPGMWGDMLYFLPGATRLLPRDVAIYEWYYYRFQRRPRVELFNFAETKLGETVRARGLEYWGCPMDGAFRFEPLPHFTDRLGNIVSWWRRCHQLGASGFLVTGWEPNRLALELTTAIDAAAASLWLDADKLAPAEMLARGFERAFGKGVSSREAAAAALSGDRFPFAGYPRWQTNNRWDVVSRRERVIPYRVEERHFRQLAERAKKSRWPEPLRASLEFRHYLAARDVFLREAAPKQQPAGAKTTLPIKQGLAAARRMWRRTRDPRHAGPNEQLVLADAKRARRNESFGPQWQLCYTVTNFAPALQLVGIEQLGGDGRWIVQQACHTIEFQDRAARPRVELTREHAAPVQWNGDPKTPPRLRVFLRGLGQVKVADFEITDGHKRWRLRLRRTLLGRPAPHRGLPELDWTQNQDAAPLLFVV